MKVGMSKSLGKDGELQPRPWRPGRTRYGVKSHCPKRGRYRVKKASWSEVWTFVGGECIVS